MAASTQSLAPIEHRTLNEVAYQRLKKALLSGRFEPGQVLTLRGLAHQLGTSVMPVRDAIGRLSAEHAFELLPNRGIRIPELDAEQRDELWRLRILLEGEAAGSAARRATPEELLEIARWRDAVRAAAESGQLHPTLEANDSFQFSVYRSARAPALLRLIETLRMQCAPLCTAALRAALTERPPFFEESLGYHDALLDALRARDARAATRIRRMDLRSLRHFVEAHARRQGAATGWAEPARSAPAGPKRRS